MAPSVGAGGGAGGKQEFTHGAAIAVGGVGGAPNTMVILLVIVVLFARGGVLGIVDRILAKWRGGNSISASGTSNGAGQ